MPGETSVYRHGYENFTLARFCDGYIFQMPLSSYTGVTPIADFVNKENLERARAQVPNPRSRTASAEQLNEVIASDAGIERRLAHLYPIVAKTSEVRMTRLEPKPCRERPEGRDQAA